MRNDKSMVEVAFEILSKKSYAFDTLFNKVAKELEMNASEKESKKVRFYSNLSLDGRFSFDATTSVWSIKSFTEKDIIAQENVDDNDDDIVDEDESIDNANDQIDDSKNDDDDENVVTSDSEDDEEEENNEGNN